MSIFCAEDRRFSSTHLHLKGSGGRQRRRPLSETLDSCCPSEHMVLNLTEKSSHLVQSGFMSLRNVLNELWCCCEQQHLCKLSSNYMQNTLATKLYHLALNAGWEMYSKVMSCHMVRVPTCYKGEQLNITIFCCSMISTCNM